MTKTNPFAALSVTTETRTHAIEASRELIARANQRAQEIMLKGTEHAELANKVINDGETSDLLELINLAIDPATIEADAAEILEGSDDEQLSRLLESRRSDRSKSKKKGLASSVIVCKNYISAMYAELVIRVKMDKPYSATLGDYSVAELAKDQDALTRKIASLRSKQSRLRKLAAYDEDAKEELKTLQAEIARLVELRGGGRVQAKTAVKSLDIDTLRETLQLVDLEALPEDDREKILALMAKIG